MKNYFVALWYRKLCLRGGNGRNLFPNPATSIVALPQLPPEPEPLHDWYNNNDVQNILHDFNSMLNERWVEQTKFLSQIKTVVDDVLFWPSNEKSMTFVDHAHGNTLVSFDQGSKSYISLVGAAGESSDMMQSPLGRGESSMTLATAAAMGRYGQDDLWKDTITTPELILAQQLLGGPKGPGNWADKVFFTESTESAENAAVVMATNLFQIRQHQKGSKISKEEDFVALCGNGTSNKDSPDQQPKGTPTKLHVSAPTVGFCGGKLQLSIDGNDDTTLDVNDISFDSWKQVMNVEGRLSSGLYIKYLQALQCEWESLEQSNLRVASVIIRPVEFCNEAHYYIDPLWHHALAEVASSKEVPIILVSPFLGYKSFVSFVPDVAVSGLARGCNSSSAVIMAKNAVFDAVQKDEGALSWLQSHARAVHPFECASSLQLLQATQNGMSAGFSGESFRKEETKVG